MPGTIAVLLVAAVSQDPALAQSSTRASPSAAAFESAMRRSFDTTASRYDGMPNDVAAANTEVADVDGKAITLGDVADAIRALPPRMSALPYDSLFPMVVDQLVRRELMAQRARQAGLDDDPVLRRWLRAASDQILARAFMNRQSSQTLTEDALRERYQRDIAGRPGPEEVRARIIMTHTEPEALAAIEELRRGGDFAELARRLSRDGTASSGGDAGFRTRDGMNPEISGAAFALAVGATTAFPIRSGPGWFVLRVEERRVQPTPPFAAVRGQLIQAMLHEKGLDVVRGEMDTATIRVFSLSGRDEVKP